MEQIKKNTVKAENQLSVGDYITFHGDSGLRVMFAGNSITRHGRKADIGWDRDWGMAASDIEKDYVHILMRKISERAEAAFCINQVSAWEMNYKSPDGIFEQYIPARDFEADIIIVRFVENCKGVDDLEQFKREYTRFIDFLDKTGNARVVFTTSFWRHPADAVIREVASERGCPLVELGDLGERDDMKAIGLFTHSGVAQHPGDLGMQTIADRIFAAVEEILK